MTALKLLFRKRTEILKTPLTYKKRPSDFSSRHSRFFPLLVSRKEMLKTTFRAGRRSLLRIYLWLKVPLDPEARRLLRAGAITVIAQIRKKKTIMNECPISTNLEERAQSQNYAFV